jgi:hypothetical protein
VFYSPIVKRSDSPMLGTVEQMLEGSKDEHVVPPELFEVPSAEDRCGAPTRDYAVLLDARLRRLTRHDARARLTLGMLARLLLRREAHHQLGFARLGDYTRERLGMSDREFQSLARIATALIERPLLARAFDDGRLCWTKLRLIAPVATADSQAAWIEAATQMTATELQSAIKRARRERAAVDDATASATSTNDSPTDGEAAADAPAGRTCPDATAGEGSATMTAASDTTSPGSNGAGADAAADSLPAACAIAARSAGSSIGVDEDESDDSIDGEPRTTFSLHCPGRVLVLWRRMAELARCVAGSQLAQWQAAEAIAAEGLSACDTAAPATADRGDANRFLSPARPANDGNANEPVVFADGGAGTFSSLASPTNDGNTNDAAGFADGSTDTFSSLARPANDGNTNDAAGFADGSTDTFSSLARPANDGNADEPSSFADRGADTFSSPGRPANDGNTNDAAGFADGGTDTFSSLARPASRGNAARDAGGRDSSPRAPTEDDEETRVLAHLRASLDWSPPKDPTLPYPYGVRTGLESVGPHALDERLREIFASMQRIDAQIGRLLFTVSRLRLHRDLGFRTLTDYTRERLGIISERKVYALIAIERRSARTAPRLAEAYAKGEISWLRALVLLPVVSETHGEAWVERAKRVTFRRLTREVEWAREVQACAHASIEVAPPPLGCKLGPGIGEVTVRDPDTGAEIRALQIGAPLDVPAMFGVGDNGRSGKVQTGAQSGARSGDSSTPETGGTDGRAELPIGAPSNPPATSKIAGTDDSRDLQIGAPAIRLSASDFAGTDKRSDLQIGAPSNQPSISGRAGTDDGGNLQIGAPSNSATSGVRDLCDEHIRFDGPASVIALLVDAVRAYGRTSEAPWRGMERLLRHVEQTWNALPRHRDPVFARDGWCCSVPACSSRRNLHDHHVNYRSHGGSNMLWNRMTVCPWHHHRGIHRCVIRARGRVGEGISWHIGLWRGHGPLMVTRDDVYVERGGDNAIEGGLRTMAAS